MTNTNVFGKLLTKSKRNIVRDDEDGKPAHQEDRDQTKHVWIVNHYSKAPHRDGGGGRHFGMARHLEDFGWSASLVAASTRHPVGKQAFYTRRLKHTVVEEGVTFRWVWSSPYTKGVARIINMGTFALSALLPHNTKDLRKPDAVIGSTVHPLAAWAAAKIAKRYDVPFVFEIRDVWPNALVHLGWIKRESVFESLLGKLMRRLVERSVAVISPLSGVERFITEMGLHRSFEWIPNGIDHEQELPTEGPASKVFTFMYIGSFGHAMDLETQLAAFDEFVRENPNTPSKFRLIGDGPRLDEIRAYAQTLDASDRISFEPRIPRAEVLRKAREAHCLVHALHNHPVYEYGLSPNKLYDYLLSGRPIIFACSAPDTPLTGSNSGITVPAEDSRKLSEAMLHMATISQTERDRMGDLGRKHALENFNYSALANRLAGVLETVQLASSPK